MNISKKHLKTLHAIFEKPARSDIKWVDIENLFYHLNAEITEGNGSRVRIYLHDVRAVFHRPHPRRETDKGTVASVKKFLENAGVLL